ncbi:uncharacterized protein EKO05_0000796 [Ascochyta rabiei]|uniref:Uncharacterized protein n=1 Tax=Didymella rabiei TaxID=5454 RepID=A0A163CIR6_DIDRA|nr:uncharacterized protein EKO05_0000796 [Ascochyta rabiei]KZM22493.1 hypothetical protein ST47_g6402 [Ascochyta rabiei]UPX10125.1 hypothetical protein EKO05_0000796 [Ascochyta rabiei]
MDLLPQELLDGIIEQLAVYDFPTSARFPILDGVSRQAILNARLVRRCFRYSNILTNLFIAVMEETPFLWHGSQMPRLLELARSGYAGRMSTLSLSSMNPRPSQHNLLVGAASQSVRSGRPFTALVPKDLITALRQFVRVKHLRYYPISPKCFQEARLSGTSRTDADPRVRYGYSQDNDNLNSWLRGQHEPTRIYDDAMSDSAKAGLALESVTFPLFGNRASYCGVQITAVQFPRALKRLSISLTDRFHDVAIFEPWLGGLKHLTFLEVAISRSPESLGPWNSFANCRRLTNIDTPAASDQLFRLEELRLMSDNQSCFSEHDLLSGLDMFPNLRKLGLAHILIKSQTNNAVSWSSFVRRISPRGLQRLWLLDPRDLWTDGYMGRAGHYLMRKYWGDDRVKAAAQEVRLVDTESLWVEDLEPPKRRDFDYPGFAVFEQLSV